MTDTSQLAYLHRLRTELIAAGRRLHEDQATGLSTSPGGARHPRRRVRSSLILALGAGGVVAAALAGITVALLGLGPEAQRAYAGWSPSPTTPAAGQVAAARRSCATAASNLISGMKHGRVETPSSMGGSFSTVDPAEWRTALSDTRGRYTMMILRAGGGAITTACRASTGSAHPVVMTESASTPTGPLASDEVKVLADAEFTGQNSRGGSAGPNRGGSAGSRFTVLDGKVGGGVTGLLVTLKGGARVKASVEKGWFLVWWPGSQGALLGAEVTTVAEGTTTTQALRYP